MLTESTANVYNKQILFINSKPCSKYTTMRCHWIRSWYSTTEMIVPVSRAQVTVGLSLLGKVYGQQS